MDLLLKLRTNSNTNHRNVTYDSLDSSIPAKTDYHERAKYLEDQIKRLQRAEYKILNHPGIKQQLETNKTDQNAEERIEDAYEAIEKYGTIDPNVFLLIIKGYPFESQLRMYVRIKSCACSAMPKP